MEERDNMEGAPQATLTEVNGVDAVSAGGEVATVGVDNGAGLDSRATTGNQELDAINAEILGLQQDKDLIIEELRRLTGERETLAAGAVWGKKMGDMGDAEIQALENALAARRANAQNVGVNGIESREGVNGQTQQVDIEQ